MEGKDMSGKEKDIVSVLKEYWGYDSFRTKQEDIIRAALEGRDVLAILPTGGGKSVCFQVPALMREGIAIVVTPLIALMKDQVQNLNDRGIRALAIHTGMTRREVDLALNNAAYGDFKFLYVSPERLGTELFRQYLPLLNVSFIVVDEAHCISQWGYDFRPDYLEIGKIRETVDAPVIALTATATPDVADDIMSVLGFRDKLLIRSGFERPNLSYIVRHCEDKLGQLLNICSSVAGTGIVYVRSRARCEELSRFLVSHGISSSFYHAGLGSEARALRQSDWKKDIVRVMVCTNAFGMGIDKPDVRFVIHFDLPDSPEAYFQEAGRAGRDGKSSYAVLLWNGSDTRRLKQTLAVSFPDFDFIESVYHKVHAFYGIPYEFGKGKQLKFDFKAFCGHFKLNSSMVFHAIKYLEKEGHWTFVEDMDIKTKLQIIPERTKLYDIDLPEPVMYRILDLLMRKYSGIFSFPVPVDEDYLSTVLGVSREFLRQMFYRLSLEHVLKYIPADQSAVIILQHDRLHPSNVRLDSALHERLKSSYMSRMNEMIEYVSETEECRSRFLLRYFGQEESKDCGCCDICRSNLKDERKARKRETDTRNRLCSYINDEHGGDYRLSDISAVFGNPAADYDPDYLTILRELIDDGSVPPFRL